MCLSQEERKVIFTRSTECIVIAPEVDIVKVLLGMKKEDRFELCEHVTMK